MLRSRFLCLTTTATVLILLTVFCGLSPDERLSGLAADETSIAAPSTPADASTTVRPERFLLRSLGFLAGGLAVAMMIGMIGMIGRIGAGNRRARGYAVLTAMLAMFGFAGGGITTWVQDGWPGWILIGATAVALALGLWSFWLFLLGEPRPADEDSPEEEEEEEEEEE